MTQEEWLKSEIVRLTAERDAAVKDLQFLTDETANCITCRNYAGYQHGDQICRIKIERPDDYDCEYEWRGLCAANTDAPEDKRKC